MLEKHFPDAKIMRVDLDSAKEKKDWPQLATDIAHGKIDILVGTQAITKGYNFPNVTLVGVIWADLDFNFPVYNAHEQAVQRLLQVIGRTARGRKSGKIILQFMRQIGQLANLSEESYPQFCEQELAMRKLADFPPYKKFYQLQLRHKNASFNMQQGLEVAQLLQAQIQALKLSIEIIGPFTPNIEKICGQHLIEIIIKANSFQQICKLLAQFDPNSLGINQIAFKPMF
jgi:primosomal protein N' (replication factor Y)